MEAGSTYFAGQFGVVPFDVNHDVPTFGFVVQHPFMGILAFITDSYNMDFYLNNIDHWLIEANYDDRILKANVADGKIDRAQANRLMLSHMSLDNTIHYLRECGVGGCDTTAKTITLCHLSERNSCPKMFADRVAGEFGIPTQVAAKGVVVNLNKDVI